jgi:alpha-beta hydrolase superfamily lysophospholipase
MHYVNIPVDDGVIIAGLLYLPKTSGPYPCVIGSQGFATRKEVFTASDIGFQLEGAIGGATGAAMGLADALAANGIAVLIYDRRGCGQSSGSLNPHKDIADIKYLIDYCKVLSDIDHSRIGFFGHSTGAYLACGATQAYQDQLKASVILSSPADWIGLFSITESNYHTILPIVQSLAKASAALENPLNTALHPLVKDLKTQVSLHINIVPTDFTGTNFNLRNILGIICSPISIAVDNYGIRWYIRDYRSPLHGVLEYILIINDHPATSYVDKIKSDYPILFVHGDKDTQVTSEAAERLYQACTGNKQKIIVPDTDHIYKTPVNKIIEVQNILIDYFSKQLL